LNSAWLLLLAGLVAAAMWLKRGLARTRKSPEAVIVTKFSSMLSARTSSFGPESALPYSKSLIREAIRKLYLGKPDESTKNALEVAYIELETFAPDADFAVVQQGEELIRQAADASRQGKSPEEVAEIVAGLPSRYSEIQSRVVDAQQVRLRELRAGQ